MQVTETLSQGLKREYNVVIPAGDLAGKLDAQLADMKGKARINGVRPGKVPVSYLTRVYGRSVMSDVVQETIESANKKIVEDNGLRLAMQPRIELSKEQAEIEAALEAKGDLNFKIALEVLPTFEIGDFSDIALQRPTAEVAEDEVEHGINRIADGRRTYEARPAGEHAANGDKVKVDFVGKIDGELFEGGTAQDIDVILGSNTFIPGFEAELLGVVSGEERKVKATFPENYAMRALAGKTAEFDVVVKEVSKPEALVIDDEFAKGFGAESLEAMRKTLRDRIAADYARASREKVKRKLLDALAERYKFEVPQGLVDQEFGQIWAQVENEQKAGRSSFEAEGTTEEAARAEYRGIAERRVRLGLLLAEVGTKADVKISDEEMTQALIARARAYPGQEKEVWDFYRNNQQALAELRAPIYEEKVVDHILALAKIEERKVSVEELTRVEDEEKPAA